MSAAVLKYDEAQRALAAARAVDEVMSVHDKAEAMRLYARMAENVQLEIDAADIRIRAERRLGEMLAVERAAGRLLAGRPKKNASNLEGFSGATLGDLGIDHKLSSRAQKLADIPADAFEATMAAKRAEWAARGTRGSLDVLREKRQAEARAAYEARRETGGKVEDLYALAASGFRASVFGSDPNWLYASRGRHGEDRSASQHYAVDGIDGIRELWRAVMPCLAEDCVALTWTVDWNLPAALALLAEFGFEFKTVAYTWVKLLETHAGVPREGGVISDADFHMGQGHWTRANPEICLLATRGKSPLRMNADVRQLIVAPVMEHSRKPDEWFERTERLVAGPYLEINARRERKGWVTFGDELPFVMPEPGLIGGRDFDSETGEVFSEFGGPAAKAAECTRMAGQPAQTEARVLSSPSAPPSQSAWDDLEIPDFLRRH